ncbi:hypothetical protein JZ09_22875 [Salmonella enterica]|nr:hypothetical protein [Salmonella enterica]EED3792126.1 hypothetical protein [Salmonella enterica subsp. enterica serovar Oranienburg]EGI0918553.1 hypothetical protein [Salmonella enterica]EGK8384640.1 hypothetical protein [Salmonella enterica]EJP9297495.1 hypothetical protein [Salmonella enterica]
MTLSNNNPPTIKHLPETKYNYTRAAARNNSENALIIRDYPVLAKNYLQHWQSRWDMGNNWKPEY